MPVIDQHYLLQFQTEPHVRQLFIVDKISAVPKGLILNYLQDRKG